MPTETDVILAALKEQGGRQEKALVSLATEIRDMGQAITKGFAYRPEALNGKNGTGWQLLFGVGMLVFGLLTPMYILVGGVSQKTTEHSAVDGHPFVIRSLAEHSEARKEIETQFRGVREMIELEHKRQDGDIAELNKRSDRFETTGSLQDARQWERLHFLEREVFGRAGNGNEGMP